MTCASCSARVERALQRVPGVQQVSVNLASESAAVELSAAVSAATLSAGRATRPATRCRRTQAELRIDGMTCATCVGRVEKALKAVPGVLEASVNLATSTAHVTRLAARRRHPALLQAVQRAGYEAQPTPAADAAPARRPARRSHDPGWKVALAFALSAPLVLPMLGAAVGRALDAAGGMAVRAGHAGAVLAGLALLPCRLDGAARRHRQHGPAGRAGHQRRLRPEPGAVGARRSAPVLRERRGGDHAGAVRQVARIARQAAHAGRAGCAARAVAADGAACCATASEVSVPLAELQRRRPDASCGPASAFPPTR